MPTPEENQSKELLRWKKLPVKLKLDKSFDEIQKHAILNAISTWEKAADKNLIDLDGVDELNIHPDNPDTVLNDNINGAYLIGDWSTTEKDSSILAVTNWQSMPATGGYIILGDLLFNSSNYEWVDSLALTDEKRFADLETVMLHEFGHFLGLPHTSVKDDPKSIMNPSLSIGKGYAKRSLSPTDVAAIRLRYSCEPPDFCNESSVTLPPPMH